jgi:hypothetical protein
LAEFLEFLAALKSFQQQPEKRQQEVEVLAFE